LLNWPLRRPYDFHAGYEGVLGTSLDIHLRTDSKAIADAANRMILDEIDRLELIFSAFRADSEFSRFQATHEEWIEVSLELATVLKAAEEWRERSGGRFLPIASRSHQPQVAGTPLWEVSGNLARRLTTMTGSLNAIAKGFIVDQCIDRAQSLMGVQRVVINIGGDLRHSGQGGATVTVTDPFSDAENQSRASDTVIRNAAVATSGGQRRGQMIDGQWHSHIIDPRSGKSALFVSSVTVVAQSAMLADVWSTVLSVASNKKELESEPGIAYFVTLSSGQNLSNAEWTLLSQSGQR
jgi:thiamine biosynthesis lipoprotein